jgi:NAD(P)-dependent dehydrogenase (short-subunit alcohol dehydrogenase family)
MNINVMGVMHYLRAELKEIQDGGSIVNTSIVAGLKRFPRLSPYVTSKHAICWVDEVCGYGGRSEEGQG